MISISEILEQVNKGKNTDEMVGLLRKHANTTLFDIFRLTFNPELVWLLPPGTPPYKQSPDVDAYNRLYQEIKRINRLFVQPNNLTQMKREVLFIELLENLDSKDANLICFVKDKKLPYKKITRKIVETAFPGLLTPLVLESKSEDA